ncbi:hypothetical protein, partial [uncultured Duncaniella sp.]|uniref:hypothetical protein n=1 Tax=uncultured Duncaniella sp. TaxID=2768039 RepID=UPI0026DF48CF
GWSFFSDRRQTHSKKQYQFIEYILECIYSCRNLSTVISGLVSLHLSDFSGGVGFDDSVFDVDRAKVTGGFGNSLV